MTEDLLGNLMNSLLRHRDKRNSTPACETVRITNMTTSTQYPSATEARAEWLWGQLPYYLALTLSDVLEAVEAGVDTVYEQSGWRPNLDNDSAWEIVLPEALLYLSDAWHLDMSTFDHIAY